VENYKYEIQPYTSPPSPPVNIGSMQYVLHEDKFRVCNTANPFFFSFGYACLPARQAQEDI
jgi:hypothetical protein